MIEDETIAKLVENNPKKTRYSEFLKLFPHYSYLFDFPLGCIKEFDRNMKCKKDCYRCKRTFWFETIK